MLQQSLGSAIPANINRYFDAGNHRFAAKLLPGQYYLSRDETIVTVLGSGVAVCIRDRASGLGGMTHVLEPAAAVPSPTVLLLSRLVAALVAAGARPEGLEAKLFGAAGVVGELCEVGPRTLEVARDFLRAEGIRIIAEDVGGRYPRKIDYSATDGRARIKRLRDLRNDTILTRDRAYLGVVPEAVPETDAGS